ncbi:MAG: Holliday junction branch migration protein RuvA [Candidatus Roizmanbacteria bacterium]
MIGKLKGKLIEVEGNEGIIMTTSGVGYRVFLTSVLLTTTIPSEIEIYTYQQIREDAHVLYGFQTKQEYQFYTLLLTVDGVGPKTAFTVISQLSPTQIFEGVRANDVNSLTKVSGLGKKTATKIILELSTKFKTGFDLEKVKQVEVDEEAVLALMSLGYNKADAKKMLEKIPADLPTEQKIAQAMKHG